MINFTVLIKKWFQTSSKKQKLTAALLIVSLLATVSLQFMHGTPETADSTPGSTPFYLAGVFVKLIGVLLLIVASAVIFRRWLQYGPNGRTARQLNLLETVRLSPKQALHLVSIGDQQLLIGATDQNVSLISHIEGSFTPVPIETTNHKPGLDFGSLLRSLNSDRSDENSK